VIGLSNIGDGVLMSPVIQSLSERYPGAELTLLVGERARAVFEGDPRISRLATAEAFEGAWGRLRQAAWLWRQHPDLLVDLRQTALPLIWRPWRFWRYARPVPASIIHMRDRHLWRLSQQLHHPLAPALPHSLYIAPEDRAVIERLLARWSVDTKKPLIVIASGARSHTKRWYADRFAQVADRVIEAHGVEVVLTGEPEEAPIVHEVLGAMRHRAHSAVSLTTLRQLAALMERAALVITNDSASLHVAGAVGAPVVALFGPTDWRKYGPTGPRDRVIRRRLFCAPCEQALCRFSHECMRFISVDEVVQAASAILEQRSDLRDAGS
jgi:ADP-heptose:LPS heptosyltransferase